MISMNEAVELFREKKYRITPQRLAILRILEGNKNHPSAEEIYKNILVDHPSTSFTTVYNTLETLVELGQVREVTIDHKRKHYDPDTTPHNHAICKTCGVIEDVFDLRVGAVDIPENLGNSFKADSYEINFYGTCHKCKNN